MVPACASTVPRVHFVRYLTAAFCMECWRYAPSSVRCPHHFRTQDDQGQQKKEYRQHGEHPPTHLRSRHPSPLTLVYFFCSIAYFGEATRRNIVHRHRHAISFGEVACNHMLIAKRSGLRLLHPANIPGDRTAGMEGAARRRIERGWDITLYNREI